MRNMYLSAPLPFVGQKRMFAKEFIKVLERFPDSTVFVISTTTGNGLTIYRIPISCWQICEG